MQTPTAITPISLGATAYTQNFNVLAATGTSSIVPVGFGFVETNVSGSGANNTYTALTITAAGGGSSGTGDTYSFGTSATGSTDRAFGSVRSGSLNPSFGFAFTNNTGATVTSLNVSYTGETYRLAGATPARGTADRLDFQYSTNATSLTTGTYVNVDPLDYNGVVNNVTSSIGLDGNATANRATVSGTISGLTIADGATFYIRFNDFDATGADDGLAIDDFSITAVTPAVCDAPTNLAPANVTTTTADVTFTGSASATSYTVTTTPATTPQTLPAGATSVSFSGLTAGTAYTVSIVSNCAGGATATAATTTFTTSASASPCDAPTALSVSAITNTTATVSFTGSATATGGYTLTTTPATSSQTLAAGATSANLTGLTAGTAYTVSIVSNCNAGATSAAATTTFTTTSVCNAPTALASANVTTTSADVTFTGSATATSYTVTTVPATTTQTLAAGANSVSFSGLTPGTAYTVSIVSNCAGGATATAATTAFTTATPPPPSISIAAVNTPYSENFNSLATGGTANSISTLPLGWTFDEADTNANTTYRADDGGSATGDTFSYGTGTATERAFGTLASGSLQSTIGATYTNNTGVPITSLLISYTGELWRLSALSGRLDRLEFSYSTGGGTFATATYTPFSALNFSTPTTADFSAAVGARNGNAAANQTAVSGTISGLNIAPGAVFFIRWVDPDLTGNDDGLAIDNFSLTANPVVVACGAPTIASIGSIAQTTASVSLTPGTNGGTTFTVTATPTAGGTAVTATGTSPVSLTGLTAGTSYSVTATSDCNAGFSSPSQVSASSPLTTAAAVTARLSVRRGITAYPSNGTTYNFGNQTLGTTSAPISFTLANNGTGTLAISGISTTGDFAVSGPVPTTIAAGDTAVVSVTFTPTALNTRTGTLVINSDASNGAAYTVNLTGNGTAVPVPVITVLQGATPYVSGSTFSGFAPTTVGSFSNVTFTIQNTGTAPLTITGLAPGGTDFSTSFGSGGPTLPFTIAVGSSATFLVIFGPTAPGTRTGTVTISSNSTVNSSYVINLSGQGTAATLPDLTVTTGTPTAPTPIAGNYNNVTIASGGNAIVAGALTVAGTLTVQPNGLLIQNCQSISGTGNFVLQAGGGLAICDQAGIYGTGTGALGAIRVSGNRTYSPAAAYIYNGTVAQVTGPDLPTQVAALGVTNAAGLTLSQAVAVAQQVTLQIGNLNTGGQTFTLLSSAAGTAVLDNGTAGSIVNGTATVQRYIDNANPIGYRHYSAPVSNTTVDDLATSNFTPVFNTAYNTSPTPSTIPNFPNVFGYNEARVGTVTSTYGPFDKGWFVPAAGSPMAVNRGYTVNAPNTALVDFVGLLNNGSQNSGALGYTSVNGGWQFLGNPYPAPLDWSTVAPAQRPGMEAAMYVFQSSGQYGGSYRSYTNGIGGASPLIPTAAGYFVRVGTIGAAGAVNLTNANRVTTFGPQPAFGRGATDTRPQLQLQLNGATAGLDEAYIYFEAGATAAADAEYDARKLANPSGLSLASLAAGEELSINGLPVLTNATVLVPLTVQVPQAGSYLLQVGELANFTGTATLVDALTGTRTVLATGTRYAFALTGTSATGRFSVEFRSASVLASTPAQALAAQVQVFPNPASGSFRLQLPVLSSKAAVSATLVNALGQTVLTRSLSAPAGQAIDAAFDVRGLAAGVYTLRLNVDGTPLVRKVVVE
ncbi:beta strand repeat-containing protein [Hymenobacter monticola]